MVNNKFCTKCGTKISAETKFCTGCGEPVQKQEVEANEDVSATSEGTVECTTQEKKAVEVQKTDEQATMAVNETVEQQPAMSVTVKVKNDEQKKNSIIGIAAVGVMAIIVVSIVASLFNLIFGRKADDIVDDLIKYAYEEPSFEEVIDLMPKKYVKAMKKEVKESDQKWDEFIEEYDETLDSMIEMLDGFYEDWSVEHKIADEVKWTKDEIKAYEEEAEIIMDVKIDVKAAKTVTVELDILNKDKEKITSDTMEIGVIKVGGKWYLDPNSMSSAIY